MNVLVEVHAFSDLPPRGRLADAPNPKEASTRFLVLGALSYREAENAVEMQAGLLIREDEEKVDGEVIVHRAVNSTFIPYGEKVADKPSVIDLRD